MKYLKAKTDDGGHVYACALCIVTTEFERMAPSRDVLTNQEATSALD